MGDGEPEGVDRSGGSRREFLTRTAVAAGAAGAIWVTPSVLTLDAAAAASCGTGGSVNWSTLAAGTKPTTYTSNTVTTTITTTTNAYAQADAFTVVQPPAGGFGGQTAKYYRLSMINAANQAQLVVTFAFSKAVNNLTFTLFDIDGSSGGGQDWWDKVIVTGVINGGGTATYTTTKPGVTPPSGTGTTANPLLGTGAVADTTNAGNARLAFSQAVTSITLTYVANKAVAADNQYIGISNLTWNGCT